MATVLAALAAGIRSAPTITAQDRMPSEAWHSPISGDAYDVGKVDGEAGYQITGPAGTFSSFVAVMETEIRRTGLPRHLFKADRDLREAYLSGDRGTQRVIIALTEQPMAELAPGIWDRHLPQLERMAAQLRALQSERERNDRNERKRGALAAELKRRRDAVRTEIYKRAIPRVEELQNRAIAALRGAGAARARSLAATLTTVYAEIPVDHLDRFTALAQVGRISVDRLLEPHLDVSVPTTQQDTWDFEGLDGGSSVVAIVDTGMDLSHPAIAGSGDQSHVYMETGKNHQCFDDDPNSSDDFVGHGTHIAGIVRSVGTQAYPANLGMARGVRLINLKSGWRTTEQNCGLELRDAAMFDSDAQTNIDWAVNLASPKADVISYSFGKSGSSYNVYLDQVMGVHLVPVLVSAGNEGPGSRMITGDDEGPGSGTISEHASGFNVVSVGNGDDKNTFVRDDDTLDSKSSRGPTYDGRRKPDIVAPGTNIVSAAHNWEGPNDFVSFSGTSMAAPHAAGAAALALDAGMLTPLEWKTTILNAARSDLLGGIGDPNNDIGMGYMDLSQHYYKYVDEPVFAQPPKYVSDVVSVDAPRFYHVWSPVILDDRFTLHWQYDYSGLIGPTGFATAGIDRRLRDADLEVWSEDLGIKLAEAASARDNVEFLRGHFGDAHDNVIKIEAEPGDEEDGYPNHPGPYPFGFASTTRIEVRTPPSLTISSVDLPAQISADIRYEVDVTVSNAGDLRARSVTVPFQASPGTSTDSSPEVISAIDGHDDVTFTIGLQAGGQACGPATLQVGAGYSQSYGETYTIPTVTAQTNVVC